MFAFCVNKVFFNITTNRQKYIKKTTDTLLLMREKFNYVSVIVPCQRK